MTKVIKVNVKELASLPFENIIGMKMGLYHVTMADGIVEMYSRQIQMSWFYWQFMAKHSVLPDVECAIANRVIEFNENDGTGRTIKDISVTGAQYTSKTHINVSSKVYWRIFHSLPVELKNRSSIETISKDAYFNTNEIYNFNVRYLGAYLSTMSMKDIYDVARHPVVVAAKNEYKEGNKTVDETYDTIFALLESNPLELRDNELRKGVLAGVLDRRSIAQTIGPRGFVKSTDGESYQIPIDVGYAELLKGYDSYIESRSASRALYMQSGPLEKAEYYNRRIQLAAAAVRAIENTDCGSTETLNFIMRKDDLADSVGKYIIQEDGSLHEVTARDIYLVGKPVKMRTYTRCMNLDTSTICETCVGHNALVMPATDNFGHMMTIGPNSQKSQRILSTKHMEISMEALTLALSPEARKVLKYSTGNKWLTEFKKPVAKNGYYVLRFSAKEAPNLNHVNIVSNVNDLTPTRISSLRTIEVVAYDRNNKEINRIAVPTEVAGYGCSLTSDFLRYLAVEGWTSEDGIVAVNLRNWPYGNTFMASPRRNTDVIGFLDNIESFLRKSSDSTKASDVGGTYIKNCKSVTEAVLHLKDLMSPPDEPQYEDATRINVNISQVEIFVRMAMCKAPHKHDYNLPRGDEEFSFETLHNIISNRSISQAFAFERQATVINNPLTYINTVRPEHPLDMLI